MNSTIYAEAGRNDGLPDNEMDGIRFTALMYGFQVHDLMPGRNKRGNFVEMDVLYIGPRGCEAETRILLAHLRRYLPVVTGPFPQAAHP